MALDNRFVPISLPVCVSVCVCVCVCVCTLPGFFGFYWTLLGFIRFTKLYRVTQDVDGFFLGFSYNYRYSLCLNRIHQVLPGYVILPGAFQK